MTSSCFDVINHQLHALATNQYCQSYRKKQVWNRQVTLQSDQKYPALSSSIEILQHKFISSRVTIIIFLFFYYLQEK